MLQMILCFPNTAILQTLLNKLRQSMPRDEWDNAWLYHESLATSISLVDSSREKKSEAAAANQQSLDGMLDESS